jgi:chromosome segregation ATPase
MPKILLGISLLLMGFAALFGLLNSNKVKTLRTELGVVTAARDAAVRQTVVKETALKNGSSDNTKLSSAEARTATAEADLAKSRTEKADREAKLKASQTQMTGLQKRVSELTTGATPTMSAGDLKAQLEDVKKQLDAAEQEKSLLTDKMKSPGKRAAPLHEE